LGQEEVYPLGLILRFGEEKIDKVMIEKWGAQIDD